MTASTQHCGGLERVASTVKDTLGARATGLTQVAPYVGNNSMLETAGKRMLVLKVIRQSEIRIVRGFPE